MPVLDTAGAHEGQLELQLQSRKARENRRGWWHGHGKTRSRHASADRTVPCATERSARMAPLAGSDFGRVTVLPATPSGRAMPNHGGSLRLSGGLGGSTGGSPTGRVDSDLAQPQAEAHTVTVRTPSQASSSLRLARQRLKRTQASEGGPVAACASTILGQMMII